VIKADANGTFAYAMPKAGWWAFAALVDGPKMRNPKGEMVDSELGGLIWVRCRDMVEKK
jgi:cobalt/nickel transport protein